MPILNSRKKRPILSTVPQLRSPRVWGTFPVAGGVGVTTLSLHLARVAARAGMSVLLVETGAPAPLREILQAKPPFWEDYQENLPTRSEAFPQPVAAGFSLLTLGSNKGVSADLIEKVISSAGDIFDLVVLDNPTLLSGKINSLIIIEDNLPSLIGMSSFSEIPSPRIRVVNRSSSVTRRTPSILGFPPDITSFTIPRSRDLSLALSFGIVRNLAKKNEQKISEILMEMIK